MRLLFLTFAIYVTLVSAVSSSESTYSDFEIFSYELTSLDNCLAAFVNGAIIVQHQVDLGDNRFRQLTWITDQNRIYKHIIGGNSIQFLEIDSQQCFINKPK